MKNAFDRSTSVESEGRKLVQQRDGRRQDTAAFLEFVGQRSRDLCQPFFSRRAAQRRIVDHGVRHGMRTEHVLAQFFLPLRAEAVEIINDFQQFRSVERRL